MSRGALYPPITQEVKAKGRTAETSDIVTLLAEWYTAPANLLACVMCMSDPMRQPVFEKCLPPVLPTIAYEHLVQLPNSIYSRNAQLQRPDWHSKFSSLCSSDQNGGGQYAPEPVMRPHLSAYHYNDFNAVKKTLEVPQNVLQGTKNRVNPGHCTMLQSVSNNKHKLSM
ncbi:hypothetical protein XENOCAPTIV_006477 [Xenoophorus captivus]|uniref:Uncharacterized protein n=1 Tax=Xenoophorus captivus TaxID=1517983 RepID=A0ABV0RFX1_9TELE